MRDTLAATLRGAPFVESPDLLAAAEYHGTGPLILSLTGAGGLKAQARARSMWELRHLHVVARLLAAFDAGGVQAVVIKGTALAYDLYDDAALRPRGDTDILIPPDHLPQARAVLAAQGFRLTYEEEVPDGYTQEAWTFTPPEGGHSHDIDLHWQAFNGASLAGLIPVDEAMAEAVPLPRLAPVARALSRPHGLLHSCVHRAQHILSPYFVGGEAHYGGDRLIWLCDIDRLARALTAAEWQSFATRAAARGIGPVCAGALHEAARLLDTPLPEGPMARLAAAPPGPVARYLGSHDRRSRALADLRASGARGRSRLAYLRGRLFPPAAAMRSQYPRSRLPLAVLYLRRLLRFARGAGL
ncbi:MAG: nucleotidyltransferase family protein [Rubellimicrobium sp.]|nr:nucleotidyltransferase family protein [Rubellimicrobium sp.]